jgi:hypothetical protein
MATLLMKMLYFKAELEFPDARARLCRCETGHLKEFPREGAFWVEQRGFGRFLGFLSDGIKAC